MFKQRKLPAAARLGIGFLTFLLSAALLASVCLTGTIATIRTLTMDKDNVKDLVQEVIFPDEKAKDDPNNLVNSLTKEVTNKLYDQLSEELTEAEKEKYDKEWFETMMEETAGDYIADKAAGLLTDFFSGEVTTKFSSDEILDLIDENEELIEEETGEKMTDEIRQKVTEAFEENEIIQKVEKKGLAGLMTMKDDDVQDVLEDVELPMGLDMDLNELLDAARDLVSQEKLTMGILISVLLIAAIILINCWRLPKGLRRAGLPLVIAGLPIILSFMARSDLAIWDMDGMNIIRFALERVAFINGIIFGTGIVLFVGGIVLGITFRAKRAAEAAAAPVGAPAAAPVYYAPVAPAAPQAPVAPVVPVAPVAPVVAEPVAEEPAPVTEEPVAEEPAPAEDEIPTVEKIFPEEAAAVEE